jgi:hypothetical protein
MASYNHMQHAAGGWNATASRPHQVSHSAESNSSLQDMSVDPIEKKQHHKSNPYMPPPQTSASQYQSVAISEGAWKGYMTIPRAVSQDQSEEMEVSVARSSQAETSIQSPSTMDYSNTRSSTFPSTEARRSEITTPGTTVTTPTSVHRTEEEQGGWNLMSPLTNHDQSTSSSSMGRYDCPEDANGTAYFSASGVSPETPKNPMETSTAISLSPSPIRGQPDIYDATSLTRVENEELEHLSEIQEENETASLDLKEPSSFELQASSSNGNSTSNTQPTIQPNENQPTLLSLAAANGSSSSISQTRTQNIFVSRRTLLLAEQSSDVISMLRTKSHDGTSSTTSENHQQHHASGLSSIHHELSRSNSSASLQILQTKNEFALWREKSILDSHSDKEESLADEPTKSDPKESSQKEMEDFGLSTQLMAPAVQEEEKFDRSLESFHKDPLFELDELSNAESTPEDEPKETSANSDSHSPNTSVNVSLGQYLSSCSSGSRKPQQETESVREPLREDGTMLSDIDVSKWSVDSPKAESSPAAALESKTAPHETDSVSSPAQTMEGILLKNF